MERGLMKCGIRPVHEYLLSNRLFSEEDQINGWWLEPFRVLQERVGRKGGVLCTWDKIPLSDCDVLLFCDLPQRRSDLNFIRYFAPKAKLVLMLMETPLGRRYFHAEENHRHFDAVLTYDYRKCDEEKYFHYHLPVARLQPREGLPFEERRDVVLINTNRLVDRFNCLGFRKRDGVNPTLVGLPGIGPFFSGWKVSLTDFYSAGKGELYSTRRKLARYCERTDADVLDIYGAGWNGEVAGWPHRILKPRRFQCWRGEPADKLRTLSGYRFCIAYENCIDNCGYISEKLFDCFHAGTVPIYLGEENITKVIPKDAFVDARQFRSHEELFSFVKDCRYRQWKKYIEAAQDFLRSDAAWKFFPEIFAERVLQVLDRVVRR